MRTLLELQNLIKRDPDAYKEEFMQQLRHYSATLEVYLRLMITTTNGRPYLVEGSRYCTLIVPQIFRLQPAKTSDEFAELVSFLSAVAHCYPEHMKEFPQQIVDLLREHQAVLDPPLRQVRLDQLSPCPGSIPPPEFFDVNKTGLNKRGSSSYSSWLTI